MIIQKMFKSIVLTAASSTFEVHFHGTNADRHGSTKDRSFRLHKQIKTPKLISYRKKLESREKKKQLTEFVTPAMGLLEPSRNKVVSKFVILSLSNPPRFFFSDVPKKQLLHILGFSNYV